MYNYNRKITLNTYTLKDIYNIPEIMENTIPFPYNVSGTKESIRLSSPIEIIREKSKEDGEYWVVKSPSMSFSNYELDTAIKQWNDYVRSVLKPKMEARQFKSIMVLYTLLNFITIFILSIVFSPTISVIILNLIALNIILYLSKKSLTEYFVKSDIESFMNKIINRVKYQHTTYNSENYYFNAIHIDCKTKAPEKIKNNEENDTSALLDAFINTLENIDIQTKNGNIIKYLKEIKNINIAINKYLKNNSSRIKDILFMNEINTIMKFNTNILEIVSILNKNPNKKMKNDIEQILKDYLNTYIYYKNALLTMNDINDEIKLEVLKQDIKSHSDYINIVKK